MFQELLNNPNGKHPGDLQKDASRNLPNIIQSSSLRLLENTLPESSRNIIIGVASYAPFDLKLLDELNEKSYQWNSNFEIHVIDVTSIKNIEEIYRLCSIDKLIPIQTTPFALLNNRLLQGIEPITNHFKNIGILN